MPLTSLRVQNAKPKEKPYKLSDSDGLHLLVRGESKLWRFRYQFERKEKMLSLGSYPEVSLADARDARDAARKLVAAGIDPSQQRKLDKIAAATAAANTFEAVAEEYIANQEKQGRAESTLTKLRWFLLDLAAPLAKRPIAEITPAEILVILKKLEGNGRLETARKVRSTIGRVFRLAVATLRAPTDPTYSLQGATMPPVVTHRPAITDERELGALILSLDEYTGWPILKAAFRFMILTMMRPVEPRFMRRNEIIWPSATWRVPAKRMKMRRDFDVPLSRQALAVLRSVWDLSEGDGYVFPSLRSPRKPISENGFNSALRRMGYPSEMVCAHGFRTSASTILNERRYDAEVIEVCLSHQDEDETRRTYNRAQYWDERVELMQVWADLLDEFKTTSARGAA
jgi:integrase